MPEIQLKTSLARSEPVDFLRGEAGQLVFATNSISATKEISHGGRRYLVAPVVALREGVLNGVYVSAAEFGKFASSWQGRPVPISHPKDEGGYTSANTPDIWANDVPGHFWNVAVDGDKLRGEIWIDLDKAQAMGARATGIVNRLRANQPVEVSTGYFSDNDAISGVWNGQPYLGVARNIRPDHLALLPDEVGACSWADGCGTPRVNKKEDGPMDELGLFQRFLGWLKNDQLQTQSPATNVEGTVSAPACSCEQTEGQRSPKATVPNVIEPNISMEGSCMNKAELIGALVANAKCKFSQEKLATWDEADLTSLSQSIAANEEEAEAPAQVEAPAPAPTQIPAELTQFAEMIRGLGGVDKLAAALGGVTANADRERSDLISAIVANHKATWSEADLRGFDTPTLRKLHGMGLPRDYSGNGGYVRTNDPEEEELVMHWPVFEKEAK